MDGPGRSGRKINQQKGGMRNWGHPLLMPDRRSMCGMPCRCSRRVCGLCSFQAGQDFLPVIWWGPYCTDSRLYSMLTLVITFTPLPGSSGSRPGYHQTPVLTFPVHRLCKPFPAILAKPIRNVPGSPDRCAYADPGAIGPNGDNDPSSVHSPVLRGSLPELSPCR